MIKIFKRDVNTFNVSGNTTDFIRSNFAAYQKIDSDAAKSNSKQPNPYLTTQTAGPDNVKIILI
jgi:hypothetical protein